MNKMKIIQDHNIQTLQKFLNKAGKSLATFTFYEKRPLNTVEKIQAVFFGFIDEEPIAYGHVDTDHTKQKIWLGICVIDSYCGTGRGSEILDYILRYCSRHDLNELHLSVYSSNERAIQLYESRKFKLIEKKRNVLFYARDLRR